MESSSPIPYTPDPWDRSWDLPPSRQAEPARTGAEEDPLRELSLRGYTPDMVAEIHGVPVDQLDDRQRTALEASSRAIKLAVTAYDRGLDGKAITAREHR